MMKILEFPARETWKEITVRPQLELEFLESTVKNIINRVRLHGDAAIIEMTRQFDHAHVETIRVTEQEIAEAIASLPSELKAAIATAAANIEKFHTSQRRPEVKVETMPGVVCWRKELPIENIGIYIPGGSAPLFSTVLMLGIPAKAAGCKNISLCTPPSKDGKINPAILFAASAAGIRDIFKCGGAQAIAALAFGTETIPSVDKIFGPGNQYVTKAKLLVSQEGIAIDMPAGPSEVLIVADTDANPAFVASDLLAQAEHGADSQVILVTDTREVIRTVVDEVERQVENLPRKTIARKALANSLAVLLEDQRTIIDFTNFYAPEHLILNTTNAGTLADKIMNSGSVFIGPYSPESAGDYASGTNHTLPTNGYAKAYSGVSLESFTKTITFQQITEQGIRTLGPVVELMAEAEELLGHKESISIRLRTLK